MPLSTGFRTVYASASTKVSAAEQVAARGKKLFSRACFFCLVAWHAYYLFTNDHKFYLFHHFHGLYLFYECCGPFYES